MLIVTFIHTGLYCNRRGSSTSLSSLHPLTHENLTTSAAQPPPLPFLLLASTTSPLPFPPADKCPLINSRTLSRDNSPLGDPPLFLSLSLSLSRPINSGRNSLRATTTAAWRDSSSSSFSFYSRRVARRGFLRTGFEECVIATRIYLYMQRYSGTTRAHIVIQYIDIACADRNGS